MTKIREIIRLNESGLSQRQISRAMNISLGVVNKYLDKIRSKSISYQSIKNDPDDKLLQFLECNNSVVDIDFLAIQIELKRTGVTLKLLYEENIENYQNKRGYSYSSFCRLYKKWKSSQKITLRQNHKGGEKLFIDYSGKKTSIFNKEKNTQEVEIFVGVLAASGYAYAEASNSQKLPDWVSSNIRMLEYFGGAPKILVPDNLKSAITNSNKDNPQINRSYLEFARHYSTCVIPARPYKPKDKGKVENMVLIVQRWILARIRNEVFYSLGELNSRIRILLDDFNCRKLTASNDSRKSLFDLIDKPNLIALPVDNYVFAVFDRKLVPSDYHLKIGSSYYSVPYRYVRKIVDVKEGNNLIEVFYKNDRIALHQKGDGIITEQNHMPKNHKKFLNPCLDLDTTPSIKNFIERLTKNKSSIKKYKLNNQISKLIKSFGKDRIESACSKLEIPTMESLESILSSGLDQEPKQEKEVISTHHENIRGANYYKFN